MDEPRIIPTKKQQSWGALLSIIVIMLMVVLGAFYAWRKHAADEQAFKNLTQSGNDTEPVADATTTATSTP